MREGCADAGNEGGGDWGVLGIGAAAGGGAGKPVLSSGRHFFIDLARCRWAIEGFR